MNPRPSHAGIGILCVLVGFVLYLASVAPIFCMLVNANPRLSKLPAWFWTYSTPYRWVCEHVPYADAIGSQYRDLCTDTLIKP